jgi:hypothetical protein
MNPGQISDISRDTAAHIIQRLGESGQPPERGVEAINVGNESYLEVLEQAYFEDLLAGGSSFKLVQGYFGGGKTHFLYCVRDMARRHGFAVSMVELSPDECPYDDTLKVYANVARRITGPERDRDASRYGLGELLRQAVDARVEERAVSYREEGAASPDFAARRDVEDWLQDEVRRSSCESASYRNAVVEFALGWLQDDIDRTMRLEAWLTGESVPTSQVRDWGVYEQMSRSNGFLMLRSLTQMLTALGFDGTALLFDEVDRNLSVSAKRSQQIGDNLRQVIDLCGRQQLPNTLFMYAVPPEFMRNVVPEYPALYQRLKSPVPLSINNPQSVIIDLEKLDLEPKDMLHALGERISKVYEIAYEVDWDRDLQAANARTLAAACVNSQFEVNHRRLFVKSFIDLLNLQRAQGERDIDVDEAIDVVIDGHGALDDSKSENVVSLEDY